MTLEAFSFLQNLSYKDFTQSSKYYVFKKLLIFICLIEILIYFYNYLYEWVLTTSDQYGMFPWKRIYGIFRILLT